MSKPKTMTLRIDETRAEALADLLEHVGGGTTSKAIWRAIQEYPALAEVLRVERETVADLRHKVDGQSAALANLRCWSEGVADFMRGIVESDCDLFYFPRTDTDDTESLAALITVIEATGWSDRCQLHIKSTLSGQ